MYFENHEHIISKESSGECITISRKALEKWIDHYHKVVSELPKEHPSYKFMFGLYHGKADALIEILQHFPGWDTEE